MKNVFSFRKYIRASPSKKWIRAYLNRKDLCQLVRSHYLIKPFAIQIFYSTHYTCKRAAKALIRLRRCAVWSAPLMSAYVPMTLSHVAISNIYFYFHLTFSLFVKTTSTLNRQVLSCFHETQGGKQIQTPLLNLLPQRLLKLQLCWLDHQRN